MGALIKPIWGEWGENGDYQDYHRVVVEKILNTRLVELSNGPKTD